jgi:hypothetical protein
MIRQITGYVKGFLTVALTEGMMLSANSRPVTQDVIELAKIVAEHHTEIKQHGHAHEDVIDLMHTYHGHNHEIADHDHNIAFLPLRDALNTPMPMSTSLAMSDCTMPDRRDYGLERLPKV